MIEYCEVQRTPDDNGYTCQARNIKMMMMMMKVATTHFNPLFEC